MNRLFFLIFILTCFFKSSGQNVNSNQFDELDRIIRITHSNGNTEQYFYDQLGNRTQKIVVINCQRPTANISGSATIEEGQPATLSIFFSGNTPYIYKVNNEEFMISASSISYPVTPVTTTSYSIPEIKNACGYGKSNGQAIVTVIPAIQLPDFIVQNVNVTKYKSNSIEYDVVIKNVGNPPVNLGNFSLAVYGSSDYTKDENDTFKSGYFLGGGILNPNQTITYSLNNSINWSGNEHIFLLLADYYGLIPEKSETNNQNGALIKKCTDNNQNDIVLTGLLTENFYAAKGKITLNNVSPKSNSVILGKSVEGNQNTLLNQNNITIVTGSCLNGASYGTGGNGEGVLSTNKDNTDKAVVLKFLQSEIKNRIIFQLSLKVALSISIWDQDSRTKIKNLKTNAPFEIGEHVLNLELEKLIPENTYIIHFETEYNHWAKTIRVD